MVCLRVDSDGLFDELSAVADGGKQEKSGNQRGKAAKETDRTFEFVEMGCVAN